jgi:peptidoglycan hydrolase-like protein with peptidoglycan-binding domain
MKVVKAVLAVVLLVGVLGGASYAGGRLVRQHDHRTVTSSGPPPHDPVASAEPTPASEPSSTPPAPTHSAQTGTPSPSRHPRTTTPAPKPVLHPGKPLLQSGDAGDDVRGVQARLRQIAWYFGDVTGSYDVKTVTAIRGFQAKRGIPVTGVVDQRTLDRLDAMTSAPTSGELHNIAPSPGKLDQRCLTGRVLCIDKTSRTLRWVVGGQVRQTLDARFGSTLNDTPTREGLFHVFLKDADHVSTLYGSAMPYAMFFSGGQAVHYSSDFAAVGYYGASHGCVNIRDYAGIRWLFSQVRVGDKVVVYWS